jgi:uncharacterized membrane protein YgcG
MPMLFRTLRLSAGAAISAVAACAIAGKAAAQVPASLLIGPDRVGSAVTYRLTTSGDRAQSGPNVQMLALRWKLGQKIVLTLTSAGDTPVVATRAADGTLTVDNASAGEADVQRVAAAVDVLNRLDAIVASAPAGMKVWKATLTMQPATPAAATAPDAHGTQAPQPLKIALAATRSDDATGATLAASGSIDRTIARPADGASPRGGGGSDGMGGGGRRGGGMGGGGMSGGGMGGGGGNPFGSSSGPKNTKVTTKITVDAHFGADGELISGTIVESNQVAGEQTQPNPQSQPSTRSWQIDRTQ